MASHAPDFGRASALPLSAVLGTIPSYPRPIIERLVARLIEHLDEQDGDSDSEANGDEQDGSTAEDDWHHSSRERGLSLLRACECEDAEPELASCGQLIATRQGEADEQRGEPQPSSVRERPQRKAVPG